MRLSVSRTLGVAALASNGFGICRAADMSSSATEMFTHSMKWLDMYYDPSVGYLHNVAGQDALRYETRSSAWYALGLLARNEGEDAAEAEKIIKAIISGQFKDPSEEWYGDYTKHPFEPYVGSDKYKEKRYDSWDPNWRGFIGTTFVLALEEYFELISEDTQGLIVESLYNCTVGDSYRFGSLEPGGDNLFPAYSNPAIMRAFVSGWTGRKTEDKNMTEAGEKYAQEILDLFNQFDTLSEFNSGTYTGVSLYGLHMWAKYLPEDSVMSKNGPRMIEETWKVVSKLWHAGFRNMAGPWDRTYGYDMNRYVSVMALWFWPLIGREKTGLNANPQIMSHNGDYAWAPIIAAIVDEHKKFIPEDVLGSLGEFSEEHKVETSAYYPPYDNIPRNFTTWMLEKLTVGGESYDQIGVGGSANSPSQFNPAVIHWDTGDEISFISLWPTETALKVKVDRESLELSYPKGNASSVFSFIVGTQKSNPNFESWDDLKGLKITVSGNVDENSELVFAGAYGGDEETVNDFEHWRFTYKMPSGFSGEPAITLHYEIA